MTKAVSKTLFQARRVRKTERAIPNKASNENIVIIPIILSSLPQKLCSGSTPNKLAKTRTTACATKAKINGWRRGPAAGSRSKKGIQKGRETRTTASRNKALPLTKGKASQGITMSGEARPTSTEAATTRREKEMKAFME